MAVPKIDAQLRSYAINFSTRVAENPSSFGVTEPQSTQLESATNAFVTAYDTMMAGRDSGNRSQAQTVIKDDTKKTLLQILRDLYKVIGGMPSVTNDQRVQLGIHVPDVEPTPIPPPSDKPVITLGKADGFYLPFTVTNPGYPGKGKGPGISGLALFTFVGPTPPQELHQWQFQANMSTMSGVIGFPPTLPPFSKVWVSGFFFNPRKQSGPMADPVSTNLGTFVVQEAA